MSESLVQSLQSLRDDLVSLPISFGVPHYRPITIVKRELAAGSYVPQTTYLELTPTPKVMGVSPKLVGHILSDSVVVSKDDLMVTGISRSLAADQLREDVDCYLVDAVKTGQTWSGTRYQLLHLDDRSTLTWAAILRREVDAR